MGPFYIRNAANHVSQTCFYALVHFCTWLSHMQRPQAKLEWQQAWRYAVCSCPVEAYLLEAYLAWNLDVLASNTKTLHLASTQRNVHVSLYNPCWQPSGCALYNRPIMAKYMCLFVASYHLILRRVSIADHQINRGAQQRTRRKHLPENSQLLRP